MSRTSWHIQVICPEFIFVTNEDHVHCKAWNRKGPLCKYVSLGPFIIIFVYLFVRLYTQKTKEIRDKVLWKDKANI